MGGGASSDCRQTFLMVYDEVYDYNDMSESAAETIHTMPATKKHNIEQVKAVDAMPLQHWNHSHPLPFGGVLRRRSHQEDGNRPDRFVELEVNQENSQPIQPPSSETNSITENEEGAGVEVAPELMVSTPEDKEGDNIHKKIFQFDDHEINISTTGTEKSAGVEAAPEFVVCNRKEETTRQDSIQPIQFQTNNIAEDDTSTGVQRVPELVRSSSRPNHAGCITDTETSAGAAAAPEFVVATQKAKEGDIVQPQASQCNDSGQPEEHRWIPAVPVMNLTKRRASTSLLEKRRRDVVSLPSSPNSAAPGKNSTKPRRNSSVLTSQFLREATEAVLCPDLLPFRATRSCPNAQGSVPVDCKTAHDVEKLRQACKSACSLTASMLPVGSFARQQTLSIPTWQLLRDGNVGAEIQRQLKVQQMFANN